MPIIHSYDCDSLPTSLLQISGIRNMSVSQRVPMTNQLVVAKDTTNC